MKECRNKSRKANGPLCSQEKTNKVHGSAERPDLSEIASLKRAEFGAWGTSIAIHIDSHLSSYA